MKILDRHIALHVLGFSAVVGLALMALQSFVTLATEADDIGGNFGFFELVLVVVMQTPAILLVLLPIIALIGTLLGLGALAQQGEIVAMRAAGVSVLRIGAATLGAGLVLGALALLLTDVVAPAGERGAERLKSEARYGTDPGAVVRPVWLRSGNQIYHIRRVENPRHVEAVTVYSMDGESGLDSVAEVGSARFMDGGWRAEDVRVTRLDAEGATRESIDSLRWEDGPQPDVLQLVVLESDTLSIRGLYRLIDYLQANGLDAQQHRLAFWQKLVSPLTVLVMMLLAVPYVLGSLRDSGAGQRLLVGVLIGVAFWVGNELVISSALIYRWPPLPSALAPSVVVLLIALWRLRGARG
ncbi:LPS export ABC transporter permease LptG [Algiphilus aromaticivorans]|uniref:LPS export ABC transporter permease LptG n=1 Tax=Algiphilus aromaticivorans TaxID=382454 RepID=UPI0005C24CA0|nr:LPS export ABC transporter permease LptG [Algiphilus aromaticivorans]